MFIKKDGTVFVFCSSKCESNMLRLGRVPRWTPWTQAFRRASAGAAAVAAEAVVTEEVPSAAERIGEVEIEAPKGRDLPSDLADLIDKRLGPDLPRGELEGFYTGFLASSAFRTSIVGWARKASGGKPLTHVEKAQFLAWKDSPEGRRVFKAWLDDEWGRVKGRRTEDEEAAEPPKAAKKAKKRS